VAQYFFLKTQPKGKGFNDDNKRFMPKELHRMKTSVINNALLSLIVIENDLHEFIIYNEKAEAFKRQFEKYVDEVKNHIQGCGSTLEVSEFKKERRMREERMRNAQPFKPTINTMEVDRSVSELNLSEDTNTKLGEPSVSFELNQSEIVDTTDANEDAQSTLKQITEIKTEMKDYRLFDLDILHLHNLKIFGDVFESLIGAVFLDSGDLTKTTEVLFTMIEPYIELYADL
jgi:dsRNA-specific ribonuclease